MIRHVFLAPICQLKLDHRIGPIAAMVLLTLILDDFLAWRPWPWCAKQGQNPRLFDQHSIAIWHCVLMKIPIYNYIQVQILNYSYTSTLLIDIIVVDEIPRYNYKYNYSYTSADIIFVDEIPIFESWLHPRIWSRLLCLRIDFTFQVRDLPRWHRMPISSKLNPTKRCRSSNQTAKLESRLTSRTRLSFKSLI